MLIIAEAAFHLIMNIVMYGIGRGTLIALSLGHIRPMSLKDVWRARTQKDRAMAMETYFAIMGINLVGVAVVAAIAALTFFLKK